MVDALTGGVIATASSSLFGALMGWFGSGDVALDAVKAAATGPLGNWAHQLAEVARKKGWEQVAARLSSGRLPAEHPLARASRDALSEALQCMAREIDGQWPEEMRGELLRHIERGETSLFLARLPLAKALHRPIAHALSALARDDEALRELEGDVLQCEDVRQLAGIHAGQFAVQTFHARVGCWLERRLFASQPFPPAISDVLERGWQMADRPERLTLHQVWCALFREQLARRPVVFNDFVATTLADLLGQAQDAAVLRQDYSQSFGVYLKDALGELIGLTRRTAEISTRIDATTSATATAVVEIRHEMKKLPEQLALAVIAMFQDRLEASADALLGGPMLLALARQLDIEDARNPEQAFNELKRLVSVARRSIAQGENAQCGDDLASAVLAQVAEYTLAGRFEEGKAAIEQSLSRQAARKAERATQEYRESVLLLDELVRQTELERDVHATVDALLRRLALDEKDPLSSQALATRRIAYFTSGGENFFIFDYYVATEITRRRLAAAATREAHDEEMRFLTDCLREAGSLGVWFSKLPVLEPLLRLALDHGRPNLSDRLTEAVQEGRQAAQAVIPQRNALLVQSVSAFRELLDTQPSDTAPLLRVWDRRNLGNALHTLAELRSGAAELEESMALYHECLDELRGYREHPGIDQDERTRMHKTVYGEMRATGIFLDERQQHPNCEPSNYWSPEW